MITGDNPLTAVHVARAVEIVDREAMILDLKEGTSSDGKSRVSFPCMAEVRQSLYGAMWKKRKSYQWIPHSHWTGQSSLNMISA